MGSIFISGGTGFLGTELCAQLLETCDSPVYVLVRASCEAEAYHRLRQAWQHDPALYTAIGTRACPVPGDLEKAGLGLDAAVAQTLRAQVTHVFHAGAEVGFRKNGAALTSANREGTRSMLAFAASLTRLKRFVHISTAYVAGQRSGIIREEDPVGTVFSSLYEKSKAEAEVLVRDSGLPFVICRPGMIVGDSKSGWARNFNTVYYIMKQLLLGKLRVLPVKRKQRVNVIPVDIVAKSVVQIGFANAIQGRIFHLTCPTAMQPQAGELVEYVRSWADQHLGVPLPRLVYLPLGLVKHAGLIHNRRPKEKRKTALASLLTLAPYFFSSQDFDRTNTDAVCGPYPLDWRDYIDALLEFACRVNFMRQIGQTVFEQAMVRRASARYPIHYYNVRSDGIQCVSGLEINKRVEAVASALRSWGIHKGDRVALTGINSVDYLVLEQAVGLIGATSVPIYYTTPIPEAELLLEKSGAEWFFVGDKRIMERIEELKSDAHVVAFSAAHGMEKPNVMPWEDFIKGGSDPAPVEYPAPEDLATIRYTSGTTGEPKGVMFAFKQLTWMGQVLTGLLTWEDRNKPLRYLSFLPLSHVVEGILASYAPYYVVTPVDYYFLNDFGALTEALPKVRPTIFFSVPRFYEKLWDQLAANPFGKRWLSMKEGPARRAAGALLHRIILKKAGLDACKQLIVGSAPVSEALLLNFRALGVEIHNAYGQTEAPLITINRKGDNVIPTIGTPLPETEVTAEPDGELIVKGPQVALGYYGLQSDTIKGGVLRTGDLGVIHENGHITLKGRKKEMIVTAYGKNISIPKIEEKLKSIPGVSEAVLIGERRPYCTALIWLEGNGANLDAAIEKMNAGLSHPEQIRKYAVISEPLSIGKGELTPNLKVKRANVEAHFRDEIEGMYR